MNIEVVGKVYYTVNLTDEDVEKVKGWINNHKDDLPSFNMNENICEAVMDLYQNGQLELYSENKSTISDFQTEEVNWFEFEEKTAEEILEIDNKYNEIYR